LLAQADGDPLLGLGPLWLWAPGDAITDRRCLAWPMTLAGPLQVGIGVYDRASGERLPAYSGDGPRLADDVAIVVSVAGRPEP
jgi:hypothetical protein